ncbi:L domain-like protein [Pluteus cervinus]|uniref:L domain-like protein n=1 Tax=Pluteus cervinus TaxID=181527 RepID=A0ACD3AWI4_9AGAR|nr:L domain-like protein [Pluteus cervinus]
MSRIPQSSSSRGSAKPSTPIKSRGTSLAPTPRTRTQSTPRAATPSKAATKPTQHKDEPMPSLTAVSIKEAIALKRAEAKKAQTRGGSTGVLEVSGLEETQPALASPEGDDILGRWSLRETIERGRSTGSVNFAGRSLQCIPSGLFDVHLGITPDRLKLVPDEPPLPPAEAQAPTRRGKRDAPAWFEAQDLQILKAWNNEILEIQHEISLFGSLKTVDLHKNKLTALPNSFADLTALTTLDLSHNDLSSLPDNIFALPELTILNLSHNNLTTLPFNAPFGNGKGRIQQPSTGFFTPTITRATSPLPKLHNLDVSHNKITASGIDLRLPTSLTKLDLSLNPLGSSGPQLEPLMQALAKVSSLKELRFENSEIGDDALPAGAFTFANPFPSLRLLDFGETRVTMTAVKQALSGMKQELDFVYTTQDPPEGVVRVLVGKRVIKEAWEIEIERRAKSKSHIHTDESGSQSTTTATSPPKKEVLKEDWEIEAEQGLLTEGGKRRMRAAAAATATAPDARATTANLGIGVPSAVPSARSPSPTGLSLTSAQYYSQATQTLTLPPSAPLSKAPGHARAFSLAAPARSTSTSPTHLAVPAPTLPLSVIVSQPYASTLRELVLVNRRMDRSFALPFVPEGESNHFLPSLEELNLEGCGLADMVSISYTTPASGAVTPPRSTAPIIHLLAKFFPSLQTLNLSFNALTSTALTPEGLSELILAGPTRKGLKHLRLRGNRLADLSGFQIVAESFKGNRAVPDWKLDELDLRDNEIAKLPSELGLLPLDVFLVDGNTFRVPQRRVWEREGTKGLLSWLRGRIE